MLKKWAFSLIKGQLEKWLTTRALYIPEQDMREVSAESELTVAQLRAAEKVFQKRALDKLGDFFSP